MVLTMRTLQWVSGLERTARSAGFHGFVLPPRLDDELPETPDEYAESLADFIAKAELNAVFG